MSILLVLLALFAGSGCAALIYEIVWLQLLQFLTGSSAVALGALLGTFMGGMCLGSLALPRLVSARRHPLRVYAAIELGIGVLGVAVLFFMPWIGRIYAAGAGHGLPEVLLRGAACALCLLPPTVLMGASLPAMARWVETTPRGVAWLGFFYGGNIAGAVFGCLLAGFYLLRVHDMATATCTAAAVNAGVAAVAFALAAVTPHRAAVGSASSASAAPGAWAVYVAIAISGLCALGAEVVWTRLLSLMLGATVYTFSVILAVFLLGLGIGSSAGSFLSRGRLNPRVALAVCQISLAAAVAWAAYMLARQLPYWQLGTNLSANPWLRFGFDFLRCLAALLPAACLWGASFPLALAAIARRGQDPGRLVGRVYAANTLGAIAGALGFSLLLIPGAGTQHSQGFLIALSALAALSVLPRMALFAAAAPAVLLAWFLPAVPWGVVAYGRQLNTMSTRSELLYLGEGLNASVVVAEVDSTRTFHVSGKVEASSGPQDMRLQRLLGHLPALLHPQPRSVLVVGCGAGVTAGSFVPYPDVERIVLCEIEPLIPAAAARYFGPQNNHVLRDRRTRTVFDDARHYIFTTQDRFDIITSDPIHPWVKGSATLYTKEYFELCKRRLNPGGIVTQWVPLYESTPETVNSEIATFFEVFPGGTIWANDTILGEGYDVVLLGWAEDARIDVDAVERRFERPDHGPAARSLREVGFGSGVSVLATYAGRRAELRRWLQGAQINRDRNLRLQYLAGMGLNQRKAWGIYEDLLHYCTFPEDLFAGSPARKLALRLALRDR
ncbi:MAG: fused MFS/spermidine synthase [Acidobacteria bacterium]|nr:fused MFS/spermidine synthase [Acidobacteriota bacterium]